MYLELYRKVAGDLKNYNDLQHRESIVSQVPYSKIRFYY